MIDIPIVENPETIVEESKWIQCGESTVLFVWPTMSEVEIPRRLEDFKILKTLDKGSCGKVYLV